MLVKGEWKMNHCLIETLSPLRISSKEAVENIDEFSSFKKYMHVERKVQKQLFELINEAGDAQESRLILVCGSVGDGKSHLLSYFNFHYPELMSKFYLHNDASESLDPTKTSMDILNEVLDGFSDEQLEKGEIHKVIIAINLGTFNNFIESPYIERFKKLKEFVKQHKIVETGIDESEILVESPFRYINFTDYHLFTLTEKGPKSFYLDQLLMKIANQDEENDMYIGYCETCENCSFNGKCPVQANYMLLQHQPVRKGVIDYLIKAMIKEKLIISTRDVLNFFYDAITGGMSASELMKLNGDKITEEKIIKQMRLLVWHNIFEGKERSHVLDKLSLVDPLRSMTEADKEKMLEYQFTNHIGNILKEDIKEFEESFLIHEFESIESYMRENGDNQNSTALKIKRLAYETYKRSELFRGIIDQDLLYMQYMKDLFYRNRGSKSQLANIYRQVQRAVYKWDGSADSDGIRILSSKRHNNLGIYEPVEIKPYIKELNDQGLEVLDRFLPYLSVSFTRAGKDTPVTLDMDYTLYQLIKELNDGYLNNEEEYRKNIAFQGFIEKLLVKDDEEEQVLIFEDTSSGEVKKYKLVYDAQFEYYEFKVI